MRQYLKRKFNPPCYQGIKNKSQHFEGWYFKLLNKNETVPLAVIPGIFKGKDNKNSFSFIQFFDGKEKKVHYFKFPVDEFKAKENIFDIAISSNHFCSNSLTLDISSESIEIKGNFEF